MKSILNSIAFVFSLSAIAQSPVFTQAQIQSARVYNNAAELHHKTSAQIPSGTSEIVITNVANYLNENTVQIGVPKYVTVMSVQFTNAYVEEYDNNQDSPLIKTVREEIEKKEIEIKKLKNKITTEEHTVELLDKNRTIESLENFSVAELSKLLDFYKSKRTELSNNIDLLKKQELALQEELKVLKGKLTFNASTSEKTSQGKLILNVMSSQSGVIPVTVSYLTTQARWRPSYEMRIEKINQPIQMTYKAQVSQNTGVDWRNVNLSLTSGSANENTVAPELRPWFLNYPNNVIARGETAATRARDSGNATMMMETLAKQDMATAPSTMGDYLQINESQLNVSFNIDIPYTILSNGKQHSVALKETALPATYQYMSIPKLDAQAYLIAKVKDYANYNLLSGEANVIFEGMYVGKTYINADVTQDELQLSLGKDPNISVSRTLISDKSGTKMLSSRKVQDFVYEITVKNNKKENVNLHIEDQYPISSNSDIEITLTDRDGSKVDPELGKLTWDVNLKPNETTKFRFGYQVKSSKDQILRM